jgi:hypothetical protein
MYSTLKRFPTIGKHASSTLQGIKRFPTIGKHASSTLPGIEHFPTIGNTLACWLLGRSISRPPNSYTLRGMYLVGLEYPYWWIQMRNEESILASSWTRILGSRSSVVLSACNYYKTCYKWGEDASSYVAGGKVSIVYSFQVFSPSLPLSLLITDARYPMASTI